MGDWVPRPAQPFGQGNVAAVTHGVGSPALVAEKADEIQGQVARLFPFLGNELFSPAYQRFYRAEAVARMLFEYAMQVVEGEKESRSRKGLTWGVEAAQPTMELYIKAEAMAQKAAQDCGFDPIGLARLYKELGWAKQLAGDSVKDLMGKGREIRERQALPKAKSDEPVRIVPKHPKAG